MKISSKLYDLLKPFALIWIPAITTAYVVLAKLWGWPDTTQVVGSLSAIDTLLGALLHLSTASFNSNQVVDGQLVIDKSNPAKDSYVLQLTTPVSEIDGKSQIILDVTPKVA